MIAYLLANTTFNWNVVIALANIAMALSIFIGIISIKWNRNQNHFNAVDSCNEKFRKIVRKQQEIDRDTKIDDHTIAQTMIRNLNNEKIDNYKILFRDHIGLINEELFYIAQGILPASVALAWLAEMPLRVPIYKGEQIQNMDMLENGEIAELFNHDPELIEVMMKRFDEVRAKFTLDAKSDFEFKEENWHTEKKKFALMMYQKLRGSRWQRWMQSTFPVYSYRKQMEKIS